MQQRDADRIAWAIRAAISPVDLQSHRIPVKRIAQAIAAAMGSDYRSFNTAKFLRDCGVANMDDKQ